MIGINDLGNTVMLSPKEIAVNVKNIIDLMRGNYPETKILLLSTLPCVESLRSYHQVPGIRCNDLVKMIIDSKVYFLDVFTEFVDCYKEALTEYYQGGLHLNKKGYQKLTQFIAPVLKEML